MRFSTNGAARTPFSHLCSEQSVYWLCLFLIPGMLLQNLCFIVCTFNRESKLSSSPLPSHGASGNGKGGRASSPQDPTLCVREIQERIGPGCMVNYRSEQPDSRVYSYLTPQSERQREKARARGGE